MIILQPSVKLADPHMCSDAKNRLNIFTAMFDTLVRRDVDGYFVPMLAASWQVSADAKTWTFTLRDDVVFHNGEVMNSADVVASFQRALSPEVGGELGTEGVWASYLGDSEITALDVQTVQMTLAAPMADLPELLMAIPVMPRSVLADVPNILVGSGPYRLVSQGEQQIEMERFADCRTRKGSQKRLVWRAETNEAERVGRLAPREVSVAGDLSKGASQSVPTLGQTLSQESNLVVTFLFNCSKGPGTNKQFRQAVNYAVNVERMIAEAVNGAATPLTGPLTPLHFGHDPAVKAYPYDPAKARELLEQSGVGNKLVVDLPTRLPDEAALLGEMLAEDLGAVGIDVELKFFDDRTAYAHRVKNKEINDMCCFDSSPLSTYRVLREKINSDVAGPWWQGYHNPQVNALLDQAAATPDNSQRQAIYYQAYRLMHDDAPWLFLYHPTIYWGVSSDVAPPAISPEGLLRFEHNRHSR